MPLGAIVNVLAVVIGGLLGTVIGPKLSQRLKDTLYLVFGISSMGIGITSVVKMQNMPAVILAFIVGTIIGVVLHLQDRIQRGGQLMQKGMAKVLPVGKLDADASALLVTAIVLFCVSGTGIYGSIYSGISGDHSILIAKSILDLFTAMIFACSLGPVTSLVAVPQAVVFLILFFSARLIYPLTTETMVNDFKACGGLIMIATGFRIAKIHDFPIADMIPSMLLVWFTSALWSLM